MSWTRRFLVAVAFGLMLAGVALMVAEKEELFLALSIAGFLLVLAAVPSLQRDTEEVGKSSPPGGDTAPEPVEAGTGAAAVPGTREDQPTLEQQAAGGAPPETPEVGEPAPDVAEPAAQPARHAEAARSEVVDPAAHAEAAKEAPSPIATATVTEPVETATGTAPAAERRAAPRPAAHAVAGQEPGDVSARSVAVAGVAAGALVLLWRRLRR